MLVRLMSKGEYLIVPKETKFTGSGKLGLRKQLQLISSKQQPANKQSHAHSQPSACYSKGSIVEYLSKSKAK